MKKIILIFFISLLSMKSYSIFVLPIEYDNIELRITSNLPENGTLVCAANFTNNFNLLIPIEDRLTYSCTSNGKYYKRKTPKNIGVFSWYNNKYKFSYDTKELKNSEKNKGMGFLQWMVVYNYKPKKVKTFKSPHHFRVLAEKNNKLYFIEADTPITYSEFVNELIKLNVKNAIYLDTGEGWQTFYYTLNGIKHIKYKTLYPFPFRTNVLYFSKK